MDFQAPRLMADGYQPRPLLGAAVESRRLRRRSGDLPILHTGQSPARVGVLNH